MFVDTHCHLFKEYFEDIEKVIKKMDENIIIVSGINSETNKEVINLCNKHKNIYGTLGFHPSEVDDFNRNNLSYIEKNLNHPKIVGIGEIGLDYYWTSENKERQKKVFIEQIRLAKKYKKTIVVHSREAINDTYNILNAEKIEKGKIIMHCYGSSLEMAKKFIEMGAMIGVGGVVTFKNAKKTKEVVENIDLKNIVLETDSPYLAPEPYRGKVNEPNNVKIIAQKVAEIKNVEVESVCKETTNNAVRQFDLNIELC